MDLAKLALFDTVMLVDDSGSMGELGFLSAVTHSSERAG